jgi:hypothetical protein
MAKKLFGLSVFLWILISLVVLYFVYGVGRREGFYGFCGVKTTQSSCSSDSDCKWVNNACSFK